MPHPLGTAYHSSTVAMYVCGLWPLVTIGIKVTGHHNWTVLWSAPTCASTPTVLTAHPTLQRKSTKLLRKKSHLHNSHRSWTSEIEFRAHALAADPKNVESPIDYPPLLMANLPFCLRPFRCLYPAPSCSLATLTNLPS